MTEVEKNNCLRLRYRFASETGDYKGEEQIIRHKHWVKYVNESDLTDKEKELCKEEFLTVDGKH